MALSARVLFMLLLLHDARDRVLRRVAVTETGCWNWTGANDGRYGHVMVYQQRLKVHRFALLIWKGVRVRSKVLRHQCDNMRCCNPDHLAPGTQSQNMRECVRRGRIGGFIRPKQAPAPGSALAASESSPRSRRAGRRNSPR